MMTHDRLVALRRHLTFGEPVDPPMHASDWDAVFDLAEVALVVLGGAAAAVGVWKRFVAAAEKL